MPDGRWGMLIEISDCPISDCPIFCFLPIKSKISIFIIVIAETLCPILIHKKHKPLKKCQKWCFSQKKKRMCQKWCIFALGKQDTMEYDFSRQIGEKISIETKTGVLYFDVERIKYIICDGHYCNVYLIDELEHHVRHSLNFFAQILEEVGFCYANRNTLVNIRYVEDAQFSHTKRTLHVKVGKTEPIIVSRRKVAQFRHLPLH